MEDYKVNKKKAVNYNNRVADGQAAMEPFANSAEFLKPAPFCVSLIAHLLVISSKQDFGMEESAPEGGFKYIPFPGSFQGTFMELASDAAKALSIAENNMMYIALITERFDGHVKNLFKAFNPKDIDQLEDYVRLELDTMLDDSRQCQEYAVDTENAFMHVANFCAEIQTVATAHSGRNDVKLKAAEVQIQIKENKKKRMDERADKLQEQVEKLEKAYDDATDVYEKAYESIPGGWELIGMDLVQGLSNTLVSTLDSLSEVFVMKAKVSVAGAGLNKAKKIIGFGGKPKPGGGAGKPEAFATFSAMSLTSNKNAVLAPELDDAYLKSEMVVNYAMQLETLVQPLDTEMKSWTVVQDGVATMSELLKNVQLGLNLDSPIATRLSMLITEFQQIVTSLTQMANQLGEHPPEALTAVKTQVTSLKQRIMTFHAEGQVINTTPPLDAPEVFPTESGAPPAEGAKKASETAVELAHYKVDMAKERLDQAREDFKETSKELDNAEQEITEIIAELQQYNADKLTYEAIRDILTQSLQYLGYLSSSWAKLVEFFQLLSAIINVTLKKNVEGFSGYIELATKQALKMGKSQANLRMDLIFNSGVSVVQVALLVNKLASKYYEISVECITPNVHGLSAIMGYKNEPDKLQREKRRLDEACEKAQKQIGRYMEDARSSYEDLLKKRLTELQNTLKDVLPPANEKPGQEAIEESKKLVEDGRKLEEKAKEKKNNAELPNGEPDAEDFDAIMDDMFA